MVTRPDKVKRKKQRKPCGAHAYRAALSEGPEQTRHRQLVRDEVERERMVRAMLRRQREWDALLECMQPSCMPDYTHVKWEGWHVDLDEACAYDDERYSPAWTTVKQHRLDQWELAECNRRGCEHLPDSAYEARSLMRYLPCPQPRATTMARADNRRAGRNHD